MTYMTDVGSWLPRVLLQNLDESAQSPPPVGCSLVSGRWRHGPPRVLVGIDEDEDEERRQPRLARTIDCIPSSLHARHNFDHGS